MWSGGIANPVDVIEQITYMRFLKRMDEIQELEERKAQLSQARFCKVLRSTASSFAAGMKVKLCR